MCVPLDYIVIFWEEFGIACKDFLALVKLNNTKNGEKKMGGGISSLPRGTQLETVTNSQAPSLISAGDRGYEKKNNNNDDELVEERYFVSVSPECAPSEQKNASPRKPINVLVRDHIQSRVENIVDTAISTIVPETNGETPRVETNNMSPCMRFAQKLISPRRKRKGTMEHLTFADPRCLPPELSSLVTDLKMDSSQSTLSPSSLFRRHWAVDCNLFLGKGSSSVVYKAYPRFKREIRVACKVMDKQRLSLSMARKDKIVRMARNEATLLKRINHPGIASFIACYETPSHIYIIMEECRGGELFEHIIDSSDGLSETDVKVVATQLAGALEYLHARKIMHRDVKPENILLQEPGNLSSVKFIDFGFSRAAEYTRSFLYCWLRCAGNVAWEGER